MNNSLWGAILVGAAIMTFFYRAEASPLTYDVPRMDNVSIDGNPSDWGDRGFHIDALANTDGPMPDPKDFDAKLRLGWNDRGLLVLVSVVDPVVTESDDDKLKLGLDGRRAAFRQNWRTHSGGCYSFLYGSAAHADRGHGSVHSGRSDRDGKRSRPYIGAVRVGSIQRSIGCVP